MYPRSPAQEPHNDVNLIEASLKQIGFKVTVLKDASYRAPCQQWRDGDP